MNIIDDVPNTKTKRVYKFTLDNVRFHTLITS